MAFQISEQQNSFPSGGRSPLAQGLAATVQAEVRGHDTSGKEFAPQGLYPGVLLTTSPQRVPT